MRKQEEESGQRTWKIIGAVIVAIMFFGSTIGFIFFFSQDNAQSQNQEQEQQTFMDSGLEFVRSQNGWQTSTPSGVIITLNLPSKVKEIECECSSLSWSSLLAEKVYIITSLQASQGQASQEENAAAELLRNVPFRNAQRACLPENADAEECQNLPLKSCGDASAQTRVVILKEGAGMQVEEEGVSKFVPEKVTFENGCLTIEGENLIKAVDKVIYKALGVV